MKTIIAGSRTITDYRGFCLVMEMCPFRSQITSVISGNARGVDAMGEKWAAENGMIAELFPADWNKHGRAAGMIRNRQMALNADALVAVWDGKSRGTKGMIRLAQYHSLFSWVFNTMVESWP